MGMLLFPAELGKRFVFHYATWYFLRQPTRVAVSANRKPTYAVPR
jgi:hypothetical protein